MNSQNLSNKMVYLGQVVRVDIDRPLESRHPQWGFFFPLNYSYVPDMVTVDGDDIDDYILDVYEPSTELTGRCISINKCVDDNDNKLILAPDDVDYTHEQIIAFTEFQEWHYRSNVVRGDL